MQNNNNKDQGLNVLDLFFYLLSKWNWFLLSVLVFCALAWYKYEKQPFEYFAQSTVIIKDPSNKTSTASLDRYDNLINKVNVSNEILQFKSKRILREVVSRTNADVSYIVHERLRDIEYYGRSPFVVSFIDAEPNSTCGFTARVVSDNGIEVLGLNVDGSKNAIVAPGDTVATEYGRLVFGKTNFFAPRWKDVNIRVSKRSVAAVAAAYAGQIGIRQTDDAASILTLAIRDNSPRRAEDVLNTLIEVYNEDALRDKNQVAINTANFINERLIIIERELGDVETSLEQFQKSSGVVDLGTSAGMYFNETRSYNAEAAEMETQIRMAQFIKDYLTDPTKESDLLPANSGISDASIEAQIAQYNTAKIRRDKLIEDSSEANPVVQQLNSQLYSLKQSIIRSVDNVIFKLSSRKDEAVSQQSRSQSRLQSIPTKQRERLSIERQQSIKASLYTFLLNRREENELTQAMADNNARIIDAAEASSIPVSSSLKRLLLLGFLVGMAIPAVIFLMMLFLDTSVRGRKDVEDAVTIPFLGEIPEDETNEASKKNRIKKLLVPGYGRKLRRLRNVTGEAFRIVRTNLGFMSRGHEGSKVVMLASFNAGAGKTFVAEKLAVSLTHTRKRVIAVDLDLRKGTLSGTLRKGRKGMTDYLADRSITFDDILYKDDKRPYDMILAGTMAPNPAELLMEDRLDELFTILREKYDYIIVDSVPVGVVADATISNRVADISLFVLRVGNFDRRQFPDLESLYKGGKLRNMALVLNGTANGRGRGYGYGYGYGNYGYGYGNYGDGYADMVLTEEEADRKKSKKS